MSDVTVCPVMHAPDWDPIIGAPVRAEDVLALQDFVRHMVQYRLRRVCVMSFWGQDYTNTSTNPTCWIPIQQYRSSNHPSRVIIEAEPRLPYSREPYTNKDAPYLPNAMGDFDMRVKGYSSEVAVKSPSEWNDNLQDSMCYTEYPEDNRTSATNFTTSGWTVKTSGTGKIPASMRIEWQPTITGKVGS